MIQFTTFIGAYIEPSKLMKKDEEGLHDFLTSLDEELELVYAFLPNQRMKQIIVHNIKGILIRHESSSMEMNMNIFHNFDENKVQKCKYQLIKVIHKHLDKIKEKYPDFDLENQVKFGIIQNCFED